MYENLKESEKSMLEKVTWILKELKIRFPVAETVRRTGESKGNVSNYLNGNIGMSQNFYRTFLEKFPIENDKDVPEDYLSKRRKLKNSDAPDIPGYVGNTQMGKFEVYADDPDMQTPVGYFDSKLFPGCNHAEKVNGDSMYPLIVNQGWIIGKIIDKHGMISGEKYCLHLKSGQNITKYVHNLHNKKGYIKIISHNKSVPDDTIAVDDINLCIRVYFIINPS